MNLQMTIIMKEPEGPISEMEKLLAKWKRDCNNKDLPLNLDQIQKRAKSLYQAMKSELSVEKGEFNARQGWFCQMKIRHKCLKVSK